MTPRRCAAACAGAMRRYRARGGAATMAVTLLAAAGCSGDETERAAATDASTRDVATDGHDGAWRDAHDVQDGAAEPGHDAGVDASAGADAASDAGRDAPADGSGVCSSCASGRCADGACAPAVFVTSTRYTGAIGANGVLSADAECALLAGAAGLPGTFKAWLSSPSPSERFTKSSRPYYRLDGERVAANFAALDGMLESPISVTEERVDIGFAYVWTATKLDGTPSGADCAGWTSADGAESGEAGESDDTVAEWTAFGTVPCSTEARLYCFEQLP